MPFQHFFPSFHPSLRAFLPNQIRTLPEKAGTTTARNSMETGSLSVWTGIWQRGMRGLLLASYARQMSHVDSHGEEVRSIQACKPRVAQLSGCGSREACA